MLSKNVLKRVSLKQTFCACDVCEDILHDIEVSDIQNQALDYRKVDVTLSESALGTTDDFIVGNRKYLDCLKFQH